MARNRCFHWHLSGFLSSSGSTSITPSHVRGLAQMQQVSFSLYQITIECLNSHAAVEIHSRDGPGRTPVLCDHLSIVKHRSQRGMEETEWSQALLWSNRILTCLSEMIYGFIFICITCSSDGPMSRVVETKMMCSNAKWSSSRCAAAPVDSLTLLMYHFTWRVII